jgi:outer membrane receptor for ferrienterochelin and colicin
MQNSGNGVSFQVLSNPAFKKDTNYTREFAAIYTADGLLNQQTAHHLECEFPE